MFSDNDTFAANANFLEPFGVTATGTLNNFVTAPILNPAGPLTGPFTPVTPFTTNFPGWYSDTNGGLVLADLNNDPTKPAIDYFGSGAFGPNSGVTVLFSDSNAMIAGDALTTANLNLILNALALIQQPSPAPEPGTVSILAAALGGFGFILARRKAA